MPISHNPERLFYGTSGGRNLRCKRLTQIHLETPIKMNVVRIWGNVSHSVFVYPAALLVLIMPIHGMSILGLSFPAWIVCPSTSVPVLVSWVQYRAATLNDTNTWFCHLGQTAKFDLSGNVCSAVIQCNVVLINRWQQLLPNWVVLFAICVSVFFLLLTGCAAGCSTIKPARTAGLSLLFCFFFHVFANKLSLDSVKHCLEDIKSHVFQQHSLWYGHSSETPEERCTYFTDGWDWTPDIFYQWLPEFWLPKLRLTWHRKFFCENKLSHVTGVACRSDVIRDND